jgi:hypothetical protein
LAITTVRACATTTLPNRGIRPIRHAAAAARTRCAARAAMVYFIAFWQINGTFARGIDGTAEVHTDGDVRQSIGYLYNPDSQLKNAASNNYVGPNSNGHVLKIEPKQSAPATMDIMRLAEAKGLTPGGTPAPVVFSVAMNISCSSI